MRLSVSLTVLVWKWPPVLALRFPLGANPADADRLCSWTRMECSGSAGRCRHAGKRHDQAARLIARYQTDGEASPGEQIDRRGRCSVSHAGMQVRMGTAGVGSARLLLRMPLQKSLIAFAPAGMPPVHGYVLLVRALDVVTTA